MIDSVRKVWAMLAPEERRATFGLLVMMFIAMLLETLSTGAVVPALALMQGNVATRYPAAVPIFERLGNPSNETIVVGGMLLLVAVFAIKSLFLGLLAWLQARFVARLQAGLSTRLFAGYLRQPYTFHLRRNSAELITYVGNVSGLSGAVQVGLSLVAEVLVLFGISMLLLAVEPLGTVLVVTVLGVAGWGFYWLTRRRVVAWGAARLGHDRQVMQHLQQGLGGAKDVKLLGREEEFVSQFGRHIVGSARATQCQTAIQALPRLWLELLAVIGLASLVIVMVGQGRSPEALLPTAGLFAAAAFRFMPSFNRAISAVQSIRALTPVIDALHREVGLVDSTAAPVRGEPFPFRRLLEVEGVTFQYESGDKPALRGVSLSIPRGAFVGFIGPSGGGKSTLIDLILGLLPISAGAVRVDGVDIRTNLRGWQDQVGYVPQAIFLTDDTLRRNVAFGLGSDRIDEAAVRRAIRAARLEDFVRDLPQGLDTVVGERGVRLSGGQRQRIGIARALYHEPAVLVLDEPTSALDTTTERGVLDALLGLRGDKTIVIVAHRHTTVQHCDVLYRLEGGTVSAAQMDAVRVSDGV